MKLKQNHRCVAPDLLGFGKSSKPSSVKDYSLKLHITLIESLITKLSLKNVVLVVHDWGGPIGLSIASKNKSLFRAIVVLNTLTTPIVKVPPHIKIVFFFPRIYQLIIQKTNIFQKIAFQRPSKYMKKEDLAFYLNCHTSPLLRAGIASFPSFIPITKLHPSYQLMKNLILELNDWEIPILVIYGDEDKTFKKEDVQNFAAKLHQGELVIFKGCGHFVPEERPDQLANQITQFLAKNRLKD